MELQLQRKGGQFSLAAQLAIERASRIVCPEITTLRLKLLAQSEAFFRLPWSTFAQLQSNDAAGRGANASAALRFTEVASGGLYSAAPGSL